MLFVFGEPKGGDDGFWMFDTSFALDIAFIDEGGVVRRILQMEPCPASAREDDCPGYFPEVPYTSALEVKRGWLARNGIAVGARVGLARQAGRFR
jgi:uncharacterized membrane protein (UPF0127 family)